MPDPQEVLHDAIRDRYELRDVLGEGGMGTVYLARDLKHDRLVAIKTIRPDFTSADIGERFQREIRITAQLQHPHILPLLDSGAAGEILFYVMPYVEGESLGSRISRVGALPLEEVLQIGSDVTEALDYAHKHEVIHRDITPGNILLTDGHALVVDFGIAKAIADAGSDTLTRSDHAIGTPAYMAPEQLSGEATAQSDVYALGAVLYEATTGRRWRERDAPDLEQVPQALRPALARALSFSPANRWPNAASFRRALETASVSPGATGRGAARRWRAAIMGGLLVCALWAAVALGWMPFGERVPPASSHAPETIQSIAVLPFENLSADPENEYFSDGITDDILTQLARIGDLKVISRTSIMKYKERAGKSLPEIAAELGVATVLEGAVQRAGDRVRVNVQLSDASTDRQLWAQTYDEELTAANIFMIQSDIARKIAAALRATLAPYGEARRTESLEAYDLYNRGRYLSNRSVTREDLESAADLYRQAIAADPAYAPAHVGLAATYWFLWALGVLAAEEALPQARTAVERALELDETLAEAHAALGTVLTAELRFEEAEREFQRALELNPGSADVHLGYGQLLLDLARYEESVRETRRAVELDPLSMTNRLVLAATLMFTRDYEASIVESLRILELEPESFHTYHVLAIAYMLNGRHEEGLTAIRRSIELDPEGLSHPPLLAWAYARAGQRDEALKALEQVEEHGPMLKDIAIVYGELGDLDRAFEYLDQAYAENPGSLTSFRADPTADSLKDDPRFAELMRKLGLE